MTSYYSKNARRIHMVVDKSQKDFMNQVTRFLFKAKKLKRKSLTEMVVVAVELLAKKHNLK